MLLIPLLLKVFAGSVLVRIQVAVVNFYGEKWKDLPVVEAY
jgi:hypothetical protein